MYIVIWEQDQLEARFQIEAPNPYLPNKQRTDLGTLTVLSNIKSITYLSHL